MPIGRTVRTLALTLAAVVMACAVSLAADSTVTVYNNKCASCHNADGSGNTSAGKKMQTPDLRAKQFVEMTDQQMFDSIGRGTKHKNYPHSYLYTGLSEQQVRNLVAHIRQLQKEKQ